MNNISCTDNIWIEGNKAWFVSTVMNVLFQVDMDTGKYEYITELPDCKYPDFRRNSRCLKYKDYICCFPNFGDVIWIYNLQNKQTNYIEIDNPLNCHILICNFWLEREYVYAVSYGLKEIIEINMEQQKITNYYEVPYDDKEVCKDIIKSSDKKEEKIFLLFKNNIYEFDIMTKLWKTYNPNLSSELTTITYENDNFWLTDDTKEIYIWNKTFDTLKVLKDFPKDFGQYNFTDEESEIVDYEIEKFPCQVFFDSINTTKHIWFIPFQTNHILYLDKKTHKISKLEISEEEETRESLNTRFMSAKYLILYHKTDGRLGLYSFKKRTLLEINTNDLSRKYIELKIDLKGIDKILKKYKIILQESSNSLVDIIELVSFDNYKTQNSSKNIGEKIYTVLKNC